VIFLFYLLAALLIYFSARSFRGGFDYLNYFKKELATTRSGYVPFATVFAPCKGLDDGLDENLTALIEQDYPMYEVIFVIDDKKDAAINVIEEVLRGGAGSAKNTKLVIAPAATESGQKVENLREAILHADDRSEVFVFVDSDARPGKHWLLSLVSPLEDANIGAATGYRWFVSANPSFASELRNVWNASIASFLGPDAKANFCWGGSTAIRRETFERLDIREKWRGTLSDDFTLARAIHDAGLPIHFVPGALTPSIDNCTFREMLEFTTRQMKLTRVYAPKLWHMSFFGSGLFCIVMVSAFLIVALSTYNGIDVLTAVFTLILVTALSVAKSWVRLKAVRLALPDHDADLRKQIVPQLTLWLISPFLFFYNCFAALVSRRLIWRGIVYELVSNTETRIVRPRVRSDRIS
jgi:ceramide glucosyltransferase